MRPRRQADGHGRLHRRQQQQPGKTARSHHGPGLAAAALALHRYGGHGLGGALCGVKTSEKQKSSASPWATNAGFAVWIICTEPQA